MARGSISVRILGQDYRIASDADSSGQEQIQAAAALVDDTMRRIRDRTGTVDTLNIAVLAALNVANRFIQVREGEPGPGAFPDGERLSALIELVESANAEGAGPA